MDNESDKGRQTQSVGEYEPRPRNWRIQFENALYVCQVGSKLGRNVHALLAYVCWREDQLPKNRKQYPQLKYSEISSGTGIKDNEAIKNAAQIAIENGWLEMHVGQHSVTYKLTIPECGKTAPSANRECGKTAAQVRKNRTLNKNTPYINNIPLSLSAPLFDSFWSAFPKKQGPKVARKAFATALRDVCKTQDLTPDDAGQHIVDSAKAYARSVRDREERFIKTPKNWLDGGHYDDEYEKPTLRPSEKAPPFEQYRGGVILRMGRRAPPEDEIRKAYDKKYGQGISNGTINRASAQ